MLRPARGRRLLVVLAALASARAAAADPRPPSPIEAAADAATNPFPLANSVQLQPAYTDVHAGGSTTQLLVRVGLFYRGLFVPGLALAGLYTFARLEMYAESLDRPPSPLAVGLQNWNALWLGAKPFAWGAQLGLGVAAVLPTATDPALDDQEFQLGPALGAYLTRVPHVDFGALVQFLFSVAGTTPDLGYVWVQPIITWHLPRAFFLKTDPIWKFDFRNAPAATVPVNLHVGRAVSAHTAINGIVEVVTVGSGKANVTVQLNVAYVRW